MQDITNEHAANIIAAGKKFHEAIIAYSADIKRANEALSKATVEFEEVTGVLSEAFQSLVDRRLEAVQKRGVELSEFLNGVTQPVTNPKRLPVVNDDKADDGVWVVKGARVNGAAAPTEGPSPPPPVLPTR